LNGETFHYAKGMPGEGLNGNQSAVFLGDDYPIVGRAGMVIIALSAASALAFAYGVIEYIRCVRDPNNDAMGQAMAVWIPISWGFVGLVPALGAAGLVIVNYARLGWLTRLIGLTPAALLLILLLPVVLLVVVLWIQAFFSNH
jgi:hypothetical protein